ncbi:2-hydroxychromene-2-carboxylate isomerase [Dokdonella sp.]|uniref:2-hydroxychromene-2-carboxylate isomerase n=1 Tax=Dokdonella sp. TaxID=2291710 RepID=UPI003527E8D1
MSAVWYFDFISPFAYLQLPRIRALAAQYGIEPRPILLAAILQHHGQLGPAEIPGKRQFTYRMVQWSAERAGIPLRFPPAHPFNPISVLRLAIAAGSGWEVVAELFDHVWRQGCAADSTTALRTVAERIGIADADAAIGAVEVKDRLRANTDEALASGVFGVPTLRVGDQLFWGNDATPMAEAALADPQRFEQGEYARIAGLPSAATRQR